MVSRMLGIALALAVTAGLAARPVDRYSFNWGGPPSGSGSGSPYVANGDTGALYGVVDNGAGRGAYPTGAQLLSASKQDLWVSEAPSPYFTHLSAAQLVINATAFGGGRVEGSVAQVLGAAVLRSNVSNGNMTVLGETWVGEDPYAAIFSTLVCSPPSPSTTCEVELTLKENGGKSSKVTRVGSGAGGVFLRKENLVAATNAARLATCNSNVLYYNNERSFVVSSPSLGQQLLEHGDLRMAGNGTFMMANGSCLWVLDAQTPTKSAITTGSCSEPQGQWAWRPNGTAGQGHINWIGGASSSLCLSKSVGLEPCSTAPLWLFNSSTGTVEDSAGGGCLMVVPDNSNNTMGAGAVVVETSSGSIVAPESKPVPVNPSVPSEGVRFTVSLKANTNYTVIMRIVTLRDIGCAGTREQTDACGATPIEEVALTSAAKLAGALPAARASHDAFWAKYWAASSIDLTGGSPSASPYSATLERAYYGFMYSFAANVRPGKVTPSLFGVLVTSPGTDWNDQLTLDYNLESVYWGAAITNHADLLSVYSSTVNNPALLASMRQRATNPGVWNDPPGVKWPGVVGSVTGETQCAGSSNGVCDVAADLNHTGGYAGAEWPSTAFPLGDGRPAPTDLATRFVGGLVATPLIQYYEYTRNLTVLNASVYPIVRDNADFYASYAVPYNDSMVYLPFTCAQEGCACRNGLSWYWRWGPRVKMPLPNMTIETLKFMAEGKGGNGVWDTSRGEHNAHIDIAFASQSLRKAAEYSAALGVDADKRQYWLDMLAKMPPYPSQSLTWVKPNATNVVVGYDLSGLPLLVEANAGATPAVQKQVQQAGNSTIIWPTCNVEYPITNFAMMWPTDELAHVQSADTFEAAKRTAWALDKYTGYTFAGSKTPFANNNGFGLSWPPVVRTSNTTDSPLLAQYMANATKTVANNGVRANKGGCLENIAATAAIAEMLVQSYEGVIRLFPVWSAPELGPATFTSLRAYGAFLVTAALDATGTVGPVTVTSEVGTSPCVIDSPWGKAPTVTTSAGAKVPVWSVSRTRFGKPVTYYAFNTTAATTYTIADASA